MRKESYWKLRRSLVRRTSQGWEWLVGALSGEWMLAVSPHRSNGGSVVLARALFASVVIYSVTLILDSTLAGSGGSRLANEGISGTISWFGGILAATYFALYARFSSQWVYLAGVYNQIKSAEMRMFEKSPTEPRALNALQQWKAGFIEDACNLHLVGKPIFGSVILEWSSCRGVRDAFQEYSTGSRLDLNEIRTIARLACPGYQRPDDCDRTTCSCPALSPGGASPNDSGFKQG